MLSPSCCDTPAACNMTPRRDAAQRPCCSSDWSFFNRSTQPVYALRAERTCSLGHVGHDFCVFLTFEHALLILLHAHSPLTQLSIRTMVCGCRTNLKKSKPSPPASEAPYALAAPFSAMSLSLSLSLSRVTSSPCGGFHRSDRTAH